ncbi:MULTISPECIES: restriction endonuclease subunit S [Marinobacter]|uniref:restriction endonuclease subunit S n=1 Tax=Marinobacter TaxID=2742 RepID=UPI001903B7CE|nr:MULTISPECIES: restriction endonuclease subunit S [unclassified Marinobacter]MBK1887907.1 restriction endonuclease subunit S [Marinobacter sp. DY40_1A1]
MSIPKYPEYKESGFDWIGALPKTWVQKRLGHFFTERREKVSDKEFQPLSVTKNGIVPRLETAAKTQDGDNRKKVVAGDFVINSRSDRKGSSGLSRLDGSVSLICIVLEPKEISGRYAHHLFRSEVFQEEFYRNGKGIVADLWSTGFSEMKNIVVPVPGEFEQTKIARFLDHETAKIDALIREQERLIALLQEKRQAVISHAVTKGLDPSVPMKDSGVEWLGDVPGHWQISKLGHYADILTGFPFPSASFSHDESDVRLLRGVNIGVGSLKWVDAVYWQLDEGGELLGYLMKEGQIVLGMDRPWISEGMRIARVAQADMPCLLLQRVAAITPNSWLDDGYLYYFLASEIFKIYVEPDLTGVSVPHISPEQILGFKIPIPDLDEQLKIGRFIKVQLDQMAALFKQTNESIEILQERRSALISAAVTGKIDVRDWQPPADESAFDREVLEAGSEVIA